MTCPPCTHDCNEGRNCPTGKGNNMTQDEIIEMARQAGFFIIANSPDLFSKLVAFANLVAAKEREACAKVCEGGNFLHDEAPDARLGKACAAAIRARGQA